jgi:hypothetical protein
VTFYTLIFKNSYVRFILTTIISFSIVFTIFHLFSHDTEKRRIEIVENMWGTKSCFKYKMSQDAKYFVENDCFIKKYDDKPIIFIIGDSHSASLSLGIRKYYQDSKVNVMQASTGWCDPTNNDKTNFKCVDINKEVINKLKIYKPDILVLNNNWNASSRQEYYKGNNSYWERLDELLELYFSLGVKKIIIVGQIPMWTVDLPEYVNKNYLIKGQVIPSRLNENLRMDVFSTEKIMKNLKYNENTKYVSLIDYLCNNNGCLTTTAAIYDNNPIVWDDGHLTQDGSDFIFFNLLKNIFNI